MVPVSNAIQPPRQSRRLNHREETVVNNTVVLAKGRPPIAKRKKSGTLPSNTLATGVVEEEESNLDEEMEEETILNGEDVIMKDVPTTTKPEVEPIRVIPNGRPIQFGDANTVLAAWNGKSFLATGYVSHW